MTGHTTGRSMSTGLKTRILLLLSGTLIAGLVFVAPAKSADLGGGRPPPRYEPVEPRTDIERWTGFYLGGSLGGSFGATDLRGDFGTGTLDAKGVTGGILAGYNWQLGRMVVGVETDLSKLNYSGSASNGFDRYKMAIDTLGTFRGRLGVLMSPSLLVYATGGYAWARSEIGLEAGDRNRELLKGWQAGLGTELMLNPKWTMRLEYLYTDLGDKTLTHSGLTNSFDSQFHTVRAGLTFRF
jgi:outer membrane immunogenic protein